MNHQPAILLFAANLSKPRPSHFMSVPIYLDDFLWGVNHLKDKNIPSSPMYQRRKICSTVPTPRIVLDAKRGDIGSTSEAYATSAFSTLACDSITASPYLGLFGGLGGLVGDRKERGHEGFWGMRCFRRYFQTRKLRVSSFWPMRHAFLFLVVN